MPKYYPYTEWEDYLNGMYGVPVPEKEKSVAHIMTDLELFSSLCCAVLYEWPKITEQVLSNPSINKIAWLGQAACCYYDSIPESTTKKVWKNLSYKTRSLANKAAKMEILKYESEADKILHQRMGIQRLF